MVNRRVYLKGNEALAYGALEAGLNAYFAYPITPSSEIPETLAREFGNEKYPEYKFFLQAASELEAINMVIGAASGGARAMTATSSPGFSLKQEGLSYSACMELPYLIADICRAGPGLGNLGPEQSDYFQATKGGGHGDYRLIVLAPSSVQEMALFPRLGFDLAFKYRNPVLILGDAFTGQLKEDVEFPEFTPSKYDISDWATTGAKGRPPHIINSLELDYQKHYKHLGRIFEKYKQAEANEVRYEAYQTEDAEKVIVAFGIVSRIAKGVVNKLRARGVKVGLFRPITLWPFPKVQLKKLASEGKEFLDLELSTGQMIQDVKLAVGDGATVDFLGRWGGVVPTEAEIESKLRKLEVVAV
ncbi:MAG TPA: 3-methyl-2-oxobutanoate dehydrogenase subunit VorB [Terriglobales bacterium]|nr:3-methyl-2-oxobutanoate dehydrogenase subunit VorB [Terriglobales bacterium]